LYRSRLSINSMVITLIIINVVVFLATQFLYIPVPQTLITGMIQKGRLNAALSASRYGLFLTLFSLFPVMIREMGWVWQIFTYMFLHGSLFHLFFNMYALYLFGISLESRWGWKNFLLYYLVTGVGAGFVTFLWNLWQNPFIPTIGASGAIFGIMLAFGLEFPQTVLLLFFILPVKAKYAAVIFGGIELLMIITGSMQRIGHFTHLAGLVFGLIYYLLFLKNRFRRRGNFYIYR